MFRFYKIYALLFVLLFAIEVCIALFLHDRFVRPYVGDFLVVIMIYCFVRSFLKIAVWKAALLVLLFSYAIETAQYFHLVNRLGVEHNKVLRTVIGSSFEWGDILAYTLGIGAILLVEKSRQQTS